MEANRVAALQRRRTLATPEPTRPTPVQRRRMEATRVAASHRRRTLVAQRRLASESDPAMASSSSSFSQYEESEQASRDDEEMATMILPHRPVPPTPDQSRRTEAKRLEHNMGVIRQRFPHFSEDQVQAALQTMVKKEMEARLKEVEIWSNGALSEEEKREQYSRWQAMNSGPFIP
ncbi:hypothetical protein THAOC_10908 [Thalassiosira oceanica]|uniref:Uncharacterized protein n=1 Tax=Thalassiosira oceanica TaxID=159749 RepID=K0SRE3_THAOC|nr:hypothetical protein THAOC_10908 [Thalassiosira oceanica]|eukprot:EJK67970.1 hypothetical protein THAOC_10908 [Thalassiosira oceanica]